jgi:hypothetical protein
LLAFNHSKYIVHFIGGFFVSRFILLDNYTVKDEEIENLDL